MSHFMADITLPRHFDEEFISLIPSQRAHVNALAERGTVTSYSLSLDRSRLWVTLDAASEQEAMEIMYTFPLFRCFQVRLYPLTFHHMSMMSLIKVSLN